jgi:hypothetical protein
LKENPKYLAKIGFKNWPIFKLFVAMSIGNGFGPWLLHHCMQPCPAALPDRLA